MDVNVTSMSIANDTNRIAGFLYGNMEDKNRGFVFEMVVCVISLIEGFQVKLNTKN